MGRALRVALRYAASQKAVLFKIRTDNFRQRGAVVRTYRSGVPNWDRGLTGKFDIVMCNPPYIPSGEIDLLPPEISRYEPRRALDGGPDGLDSYRALAPSLARRLAGCGFAAVEIGADQRPVVETIFVDAGLRIAACVADLAGASRCLVVRIKMELT